MHGSIYQNAYRPTLYMVLRLKYTCIALKLKIKKHKFQLKGGFTQQVGSL